MFKMKRLVFLLFGFLMLCSVGADATAQNAAGHIAIGRGHLANQTLAELQAADSSFGSALALEPANQTANVLKAITRLTLLFGKPEFSTMLSGLGVTVLDPSPYHFTYQTNEDAAGRVIPASGATTDMVLNYANATLLPELNGAIANLQMVTDTAFLLQLSAAETSMLATNIDYGDVQVALAGLLGAKATVALANTQNISVSLPVIYNLAAFDQLDAERVLDCFPALLTYTGVNQRPAAKSAFQSANAAYQIGSNFIRTLRNPLPGTDYLFAIDPQETLKEQRFRTRLAGLSGSLDGQTVIEGLPIHLAPALTTAVQARSLLPQLSGNSALPNTWRDATLAGTLPTGTQGILNQAAKDVDLLYLTRFTITVLPTSSGGYAGGGRSVESGSSVTVWASPVYGYSFVNWTEGGIPVSTSPNYTFTASADRTLVANFALIGGYHVIATEIVPSNGGTTPYGNELVYPDGLSAMLIVSPNPGFVFVNWTEGGIPVSTDANYTFIVNADRSLVAHFTPGFTISSDASPSEGGFTAGNGGYPTGSNVTLTANPYYGFDFVNWTENGIPVSTSASYSFTSSADRTLVANFTVSAGFYAITTSISPPNNPSGSFVGDAFGGGAFTSGSSVTVYAFPGYGYDFVNWTVGGVPVSTSATYTFTATANRNLVANFAPSAGFYAIATTAAPAAGGSIFGGGLFTFGSFAGLFSSANPGYAFVNWTENGIPVSTSPNLQFTVFANRNLVAHFAPAYTIMADTSPAGGGYASGFGSFAVGANVTVVATPNSGHAFVNWTENGIPVSTSGSYSFTANANRTLVANFTRVYAVFASPSPVPAGSVGGFSSGSVPGPVALAPGFGITVTPGSAVNLAATPTSGFAVANWIVDGAVAQTGGTAFALNNVTASHTITVTFQPAGQTPLQTWRQTWYFTTDNTGDAADLAEPYHRGILNLEVFAFFGPGQNPATAQISQLPQAVRTGGVLSYNFTQPVGVSGITYGAEWTLSLGSPDWHSITDAGSGGTHIFSTPASNAELYIRLRVSRP